MQQWWSKATKIETILSLAGAVSAALTYAASISDKAPKEMTSIGWLVVLFAVAFAAVGLVGFAGWARHFLTSNGRDKLSSDDKSRGGLAAGFVKHAAARQDDIEDGSDWVRVCVGLHVEVAGTKVYKNVRAKAEAFDPGMWRFHDETFFSGDIRPGEDVECYPIELHMHKTSHQLRYKRDGTFVLLGMDEEISVRLIVTSDDFMERPIDISRAIRHPIDVCEHFILTENSIERE